MAGRRQQLSDSVLGSPASLWAKLPEYVFEAAVKHFEMLCKILKGSTTVPNVYSGNSIHGVAEESSTVFLSC
jgi:hypothetical protein